LIKEIIKGLNLDDKVYKPNLVHNRISAAKNNLLSPAAYKSNLIITKEDAQSKKPEIGRIYEIYDQRCFKAGAMDFDDLLFKTNILLRDFPDVLNKYQSRFQYILVDEYQDTNFSQYIIVKALAAKYENICVVGDDAQSIYSFRGANIQNILNFKKDYPDTTTFKLEQNYRSTKNIVNAANSIIDKNVEQLKKKVWTSNDDGHKIKLFRALTENEEGLNIARTIFEVSNNQQEPFSDFTILYRTNAQSRAMEDALRKLNIPYKIYGGLSFYQRKEIKDLMAYFRLVINRKDEDALKRVINYPARGIGKTTMDKITLYANENDINLWDLISSIDQYQLPIHGGAKNKIKQFAELIKSFSVIAQKKDAYEVGSQIASTTGILKELYKDKSIEGVSRYENLQELLNSMKEFVEDDTEDVEKTLANYVQDIPLLTDQDTKNEEDANTVTLMTIHASKGLEFPYVFIVGLEENLFPSQLSINSRSELEEERRLFYVALTRAEKQCWLSFATSRYKWGNLIHSEPSRFIEEIDPIYIDASGAVPTRGKPMGHDFEGGLSGRTNPWAQSKPTGSPTPKTPRQKLVKVPSNKQENTFQGDDTSGLKEGTKVEHARFGLGVVKTIEGQPGNIKATVAFEGVGDKQLLLKFAKLKILN
jgi:DNA helicase-2/ATP-dependent DNA helicase PcrA